MIFTGKGPVSSGLSGLVLSGLILAAGTVAAVEVEEVRQDTLNRLTSEAASGRATGRQIEDCQDLEDQQERLACYDEVSESMRLSTEKAVSAEGAAAARTPNALDRRVEEEELLAENSFLIVPHRRNYILPYTYNDKPYPVVSSPTREPASTVEDLQRSELKYQLSFKVQMLRNFFPERLTAWAGYTQVGFWQVYNTSSSRPFRNIDHEPELFLRYRTNLNLLGYSSEYFLLGINHHSNGRSKPVSRSWNRIFAAFTFNKDNFSLGIRPWYRIPENEEDDDNPDIHQYLGYAELTFAYKISEAVIDLRMLNNFREEDNKTSAELSLTLPLPGRLKVYLQYYNGYGESLLDYNHRNQRIGIGVLLTDLY